MQNMSCIVNFFKRLVYTLHNFCVEIVRWCSSFPSIFLYKYLGRSNIQRAYDHHSKYAEDDDHLNFFKCVKGNVELWDQKSANPP